jgi:hypothetical protein
MNRKQNDYDNYDLFQKKYNDFFLEIYNNSSDKDQAKKIIKCFGNSESNIGLKLLEESNELSYILGKYKIDQKHAIFDIMAMSARTIELPVYYKQRLKSILNHPYINSYEIHNDNKIILDTTCGEYVFHQIVNKNKTINNLKTLKRYLMFHSNEYTGRCHEIAVQHCMGFNCVTGIVNSLFDDLGVVHSWIEDNLMVYDMNHNFAIKKDKYYQLNNAEIISNISSDILIEQCKKLTKANPSFGVRDFLINHSELCKQHNL